MRAFLLLFLLSAGAALGQVTLIDNTDCSALDDPHNCCTGAGAGTCDGKVKITKIMARHVMVEVCRGFWFRTCADTGIDTDGDGSGDQWLVEAGTCTQGEADASAALPVVTCTATRLTDKECRNEFSGSAIMPQVSACRPAFKTWFEFEQIQPDRNTGRRTWRQLDSTPPDDSDIVLSRLPNRKLK